MGQSVSLGAARVATLGFARRLVFQWVGEHDAVLVAERTLALNLVLALDETRRDGAAHGLDT